MYGMKEHRPARNYFATIRSPSGNLRWDYVRTNLGCKTAYAIIAKRIADLDGYKIIDFRDQTQATDHDRAGLAQEEPPCNV